MIISLISIILKLELRARTTAKIKEQSLESLNFHFQFLFMNKIISFGILASFKLC